MEAAMVEKKDKAGGKRKKLSTRVMLYCVILALALCVVLGGLGYYIYYNKSMESYKMYIGSMLNIVDSTIDADDMRECIQNRTTSEKYENTQMRINNIKTNTMVEFIYIIAPTNPDHIEDVIYVCNAFTEEERVETPEDLVSICDPVQENAFPEFMLEVFNQTMYKDKDVSYIPNNAGFGNMLTGTKPVVDSEGNTVCLICVDFSMQEIYNTLYDYIITVIAGTVITAMIVLAVVISRIKRTIVRPIKEMAESAGDFVQLSHSTDNVSGLSYRHVPVSCNDEICLLSDSISRMTEDMLSYMQNLTKVTADRERISAELNVATQIQKSMIPRLYPAFPERAEFEIYGHIRSAQEMGGAFYDYFFIDNRYFGFFIGDINSTGIPAALMLVITRTMIKNYSQLGYSVDKICQETNNQLSGNNESAGMKITAFIGIIDLKTGILSYVNAGHKTPYLKHSGEAFEPLPSRGCFALGSMVNVPYWMQTVQLVQGDLLYLYTSGLTDACDRKGEAYSENRLLDTLNCQIEKVYAIENMAENIEHSVVEFMDGALQEKDIAALLFRYFGG